MTRTLLLLAVALPAAAQAPAEPPKKPENPPERRSLNLRLDNPSSFATTNPDKARPKDLPALGGDARAIRSDAPQPGERGSPFPKDTNPTQ